MKISAEALEGIRAHGEEGYPYEICGIMVGRAGRRASVTEVHRARNTVTDRAHDRYEIDPVDYIRIERDADRRGLEVVGYYHSHPDHPAQASATDAQRSWAGPVYVIVAVHQGKAVDQNAFVAERDGGPMRGEPLEVG